MERQSYELDKQALGSFLAQLRKEKGWTQKDLAERLYISDKAVSKWERGLSAPDVSMLMRNGILLCNAKSESFSRLSKNNVNAENSRRQRKPLCYNEDIENPHIRSRRPEQ